jgi:hypothetical protein
MPKPIPESCAHLDLEAVELELIRAGASVKKAAEALGVPRHDLRLLTLAHPRLMDAALEAEELALDEAEAIVRDTLRGDDMRKRIRAAGFLLRNSAAGRRRGFGPGSNG